MICLHSRNGNRMPLKPRREWIDIKPTLAVICGPAQSLPVTLRPHVGCECRIIGVSPYGTRMLVDCGGSFLVCPASALEII